MCRSVVKQKRRDRTLMLDLDLIPSGFELGFDLILIRDDCFRVWTRRVMSYKQWSNWRNDTFLLRAWRSREFVCNTMEHGTENSPTLPPEPGLVDDLSCVICIIVAGRPTGERRSSRIQIGKKNGFGPGQSRVHLPKQAADCLEKAGRQ